MNVLILWFMNESMTNGGQKRLAELQWVITIGKDTDQQLRFGIVLCFRNGVDIINVELSVGCRIMKIFRSSI